MDWTKNEIDLIIKEYFLMLENELNGISYKKSEHRRKIISDLNGRSNGALESKHQNISAVLADMGIPFIKGYKPRNNYQKLLKNEVIQFLFRTKDTFEHKFEEFSENINQLNKQPNTNFEHMMKNPPKKSLNPLKVNEPIFLAKQINYIEREQNNRTLGLLGEELIFNYEKWRLERADRNNLASKIEWVSKNKGDGLGYDILSKNINGSDRYIEVKTTKLSKDSPFYVSKREVYFASKNAFNFFIYRVYEWGSSPKFFIKNGEYNSYCFLEPENYKCYF